jgi:hypothetical protein
VCSLFVVAQNLGGMPSAIGHLVRRHASLTVAEELIPPKRVSFVAMKIRYLIESVVNVEINVNPSLLLSATERIANHI